MLHISIVYIVYKGLSVVSFASSEVLTPCRPFHHFPSSIFDSCTARLAIREQMDGSRSCRRKMPGRTNGPANHDTSLTPQHLPSKMSIRPRQTQIRTLLSCRHHSSVQQDIHRKISRVKTNSVWKGGIHLVDRMPHQAGSPDATALRN